MHRREHRNNPINNSECLEMKFMAGRHVLDGVDKARTTNTRSVDLISHGNLIVQHLLTTCMRQLAFLKLNIQMKRAAVSRTMKTDWEPRKRHSSANEKIIYGCNNTLSK